MKYTTYLLFLFIALYISACSDDKDEPDGDDKERPETLAWIEDTMRKHYYWYNEIPAASKLDYTSEEKDFFNSLLTTKDGRTIKNKHYPYSYIENLSDNTRSTIRENLSYGIEFTGIYLTKTEIGALILYVVPGSPADDAKLKRGDWILKIDNAPITTNEIYGSLQGIKKDRILTIARWDPNEGKTGSLVETREDVVLAAARPVVDNPIYTYDFIPRGNKKVGYLLYNHFTAGIDDTDESYDNELRTLSSKFKGVDDFILDLRYNNGGLLSSAMLLCAILCPESYLDSRLGYLKYNDKQTQPNRYFDVSKNDLNPGGTNLNLSRLYVLTSSSTASSSEMIINSLRVFMNVIVIGDQTVGKNVGSIAYPNKDNPYPYGTTTWSMHPIVCQISNKNNYTDYAEGFIPGTWNANGHVASEPSIYIDEAFDYYVNEKNEKYAELVEVLPLGDENERMLKVALDMIDATNRSTRSTSTINANRYKIAPFNSIDRKATNGVIINE